MNDELKQLLIRLERLSPMPDDDSLELTVDRLREYENVIRQLEETVMHEKERDPSLVMPLLASFGYGDGFGLYWATLHLLEKFPLAVLQPALREAVLNGHKGTRRWAAYMIGRLRDSNDVSIHGNSFAGSCRRSTIRCVDGVADDWRPNCFACDGSPASGRFPSGAQSRTEVHDATALADAFRWDCAMIRLRAAARRARQRRSRMRCSRRVGIPTATTATATLRPGSGRAWLVAPWARRAIR